MSNSLGNKLGNIIKNNANNLTKQVSVDEKPDGYQKNK